VPVRETVSVIISMINGMIRQYSLLKGERCADAKDVAIEFCRRSLLDNQGD
jgi:hypothetical protein